MGWKERLCLESYVKRLFFFFFKFTDAHYFIFLVIFSTLLLMKQKLRVKRFMHYWKVSPKTLWYTTVYTVTMVNDIYTHICCNDFLPHFFPSQLFIYSSALAWSVVHIWQIYASQSSHNVVQTYINLKVPYATMYYSCLPFSYLSPF